jgi:predicted nucleic acid-binding protein
VSVFADTSAVVKLYADEPGHGRIRALEAMYVSQLCRIEAPAAVWRKNRMGEIDAETAAVLVAAFEHDFFVGTGALAPVAVDAAALDKAAALAAVHGLRAYDAVQLACALRARMVDPACQTMAVFDRDLRDAAAKEGFGLIP